MNRNIEIRRICCYAAIKAGYSGKNYLTAHMRLVLALIYKKAYSEVEPARLVEDFKNENLYEIPYFAMVSILGLAVSEGYLQKERTSKRFVPTTRIREFSNVFDDLSKGEYQYQLLVEQFVSYCLECQRPIDRALSEETIITYVEQQKLNHISGHLKFCEADGSIEFLFNKFIYALKQKETPSFEFLCNMVVGSILADCLMYSEEIERNDCLNRLTLILDTSVAFICLDIDTADRGPMYREMLSELTNRGAKLAIFPHTFDEMQVILQGATDWVDSPSYNPALASDTLAYFRDKRVSREYVEAFSIQLKARLLQLGIEIIEVPHDVNSFAHHVDETRLHEMIEERYAQTNPRFDKAAQWNSIHLDAQSIAYTYILRAGLKPTRISDATYVFITKNSSISQVAFDYHNKICDKHRTLPVALTDVFLGTYTWLENPVKIAQINSYQMISEAFLAFQPNDALLEKLVNALDDMEKDGEITPEICYSLKSNRLVSEKLANKTLGNPDAFTVSTAHEIYQEILQEAKESGREEERVRSAQEINSIRQQESAEKDTLRTERDKSTRALIDSLNKNLETAQSKLDELNRLEKKAQKGKRIWRFMFGSLAIVLSLSFLFGVGLFLLPKYKESLPPLVAHICTVMPAAIALFFFGVSFISGNTINLQNCAQNFIERRYLSNCEKLGCSHDAREKIELEIQDTIAQIKKYTDYLEPVNVSTQEEKNFGRNELVSN